MDAPDRCHAQSYDDELERFAVADDATRGRASEVRPDHKYGLARKLAEDAAACGLGCRRVAVGG